MSEEASKIHWLLLDKACLGKENDNLMLSENWSWRLYVDQGGSWFKVLAAKYGVK